MYHPYRTRAHTHAYEAHTHTHRLLGYQVFQSRGHASACAELAFDCVDASLCSGTQSRHTTPRAAMQTQALTELSCACGADLW
jgi:hypothetical protein